jgi:putative Mn2+ efflux pump MntP
LLKFVNFIFIPLGLLCGGDRAMGEATNNLLKTVGGIIVVVIGLAWYVKFFPELLVLLKGSIGAVIFLVGLLWAWMSYEDYKMAKETEKEKEKK